MLPYVLHISKHFIDSAIELSGDGNVVGTVGSSDKKQWLRVFKQLVLLVGRSSGSIIGT
jgi:hypothetical protein